MTAHDPAAQPEGTDRRTTCLVAVWDDGIYRTRCSMGSEGICGKHGPHRPHPNDGRHCDLMSDGYCGTHGVYADPYAAQPAPPVRDGEAEGLAEDVLVAYIDHLPVRGIRDMRQHCICGWKSDSTDLVHRAHAAREIARVVTDSGWLARRDTAQRAEELREVVTALGHMYQSDSADVTYVRGWLRDRASALGGGGT